MNCPICRRLVKSFEITSHTTGDQTKGDVPDPKALHTHSVGPCGHEVSCEAHREMKIRMCRKQGWLPKGQTLAFNPACEFQRSVLHLLGQGSSLTRFPQRPSPARGSTG